MRLKPVKKALLSAAGIIGIAACLADLVMLYVFGKQIPGYNHVTDSISLLGVSQSPVSDQVTHWSVWLGIFFILFSLGFREVFRESGKTVRTASWLIIIYALGEGVASGVFKADSVNGVLTFGAWIHDLLGGVGVVAAMLLPLALMRIFSKQTHPALYRFFKWVAVIGPVSTLMFGFRIAYFEHTILHDYTGIWQRVFLVNLYACFVVLAFVMFRKIKTFNTFKISNP